MKKRTDFLVIGSGIAGNEGTASELWDCASVPK